MVTLLNSLGYQIMVGGAAALEHLGSTTRVNLLLTAVVLASGMNGRELAAEVGSPPWNIQGCQKICSALWLQEWSGAGTRAHAGYRGRRVIVTP